MSDESDKGGSAKKTPSTASAPPPPSHTGSWRRGMSAQVGVTSPRTKSTGSGAAGSTGIKTHSAGEGGGHLGCVEALLLIGPR